MCEVNEMTAYKYSDNYRIESSDGLNVFGCEHNQQEAKAIAAYLSGERGIKAVIVKNSRSDVEAAKNLRAGREPIRYQFRDEAFKATGVY